MSSNSGTAKNEFQSSGALFTTLSGSLSEEDIVACLEEIAQKLKAHKVRVWCVDTSRIEISPDIALIGGYIAVFAEVNRISRIVAISSTVSTKLTERAMQLLTSSSICFVLDRKEAEKEIASILRV